MSASRQKPLIIVIGPTATGKTEVALALARRFGGEIIGADAYQIYRGMDIGTAKPTAEELGDVTHHMLDILDPDEHFDAHEFVERADPIIATLQRRDELAIVAGGTGLYLRTLIRGLADMPGADADLRASLADRAQHEGSASLHAELARVDAEYAARIQVNDLVRIIRALEVHELSGRTMTELHQEHQQRPDRHPSLWIGLDPGRDTLRDRIEARAQRMFEAGFVDEVRRLLDAGYGPKLPPMKALGYRAVCDHLAGGIDEAEARRLTARDTMRYAKRQRNWFRHEPQTHWFERPTAEIEHLVEQTIL